MSDFSIKFTNPWLLFLAIPALACILIPFFLSDKKYRNNRNRIISVVLHAIVMALVVCVIAGMTFDYNVANKQNEVLILVDQSHSGASVEDARDEFVKNVLDDCPSGCKVGIVTFGYNQVYAAPLSSNTDDVYEKYLSAARPDDSATDIASALTFAKEKFSNTQSAKIVLISDGIETDRSAMTIIKTVAADGIKVDTVRITGERSPEAQLIDIVLPDYNIVVGDTFEVGVTVQSSYVGKAEVTVYDNGVAGNSKSVDLLAGVQTFRIEHSFAQGGMHEIGFVFTSEGDNVIQNNSYYSYLFLESFDKILLIDGGYNSSAMLGSLLGDYSLDIVQVDDYPNMPHSVDELRMYDQVILNNVSPLDMPEGFDECLYSYVYDYGGGMFTIGGNRVENGKAVANAYNVSDMENAPLYHRMLPVQVIDYTPPLGLMIIIDRSASMSNDSGGADGKSYLTLAKEGAISCLNSLTERDWCGVMTLESTYQEEVQLTSMTEMSKIVSSINAITIGGGTVFAGALNRAGEALKALTSVEKKHIILITDGQPGDPDQYPAEITRNKNNDITLSIIVVGASEHPAMRYAAEELGGGKFYGVVNTNSLSTELRTDLSLPAIKEINYKPFTPQIKDHTSVINGITQADIPSLAGYYGTKVKDGEGVYVPLTGEFVPIYAQWKFGAGMVGSFMSDLNGSDWSSEFLSKPAGIQIVYNIVNGLFPTKNIRPHDIDAEFTEDNYTTQISVYTTLSSGERVEVQLCPMFDGIADETKKQTIKPNTLDGFSRLSFTVTTPGIYQVAVQKKDLSDDVISEYVLYKSFSYSEEYDTFTEGDDELLAKLAAAGNGAVITDSMDIYDNFKKIIPKSANPSLAFMIIAMVLFLLEIAVRKFKFKWIHELVRERKENRNSANGADENSL